MWIDDDLLRRCNEPTALSCWVPESPVVVLGSSNQAQVETDAEACARDGVPVLKRYGGGGTVVLHAGCAVVSIATWVRQHFQNGYYFERLNLAVIDALASRWPVLAGLKQNGLSDITFGDKKVAGTSLFRSRNYLLYQASLLVDPQIELIERYLRHPSREPDYRQGRSHGQFLTGLGVIEPEVTAAACAEQLKQALTLALAARLEGEMIEPQTEQFPGLLRRAEGQLG